VVAKINGISEEPTIMPGTWKLLNKRGINFSFT
jgi:hypothetical protein